MQFKQMAAAFIGTVVIVGTLPLSTLAKDSDTNQKGSYKTKDEAIYGKLSGNGTLENMYVVNTFHDTKPGTITDHGDYTNVRNLSNLTDIKQSDDGKVNVKAEKGDEDFHYQGQLKDKELPWNIDITYTLDGKKVNPDKLAGQDGKLEIQLKTSGNDDADPVFFENYMMQISVTLDPVHADNIQAPDANKAKSGKDTVLTFTVMPEKKETFIVSADVDQFEMDPIKISASPASMPIDDPDLDDMKGDISSLSDAIKKINNGVGDLNSGVSELNKGAKELNNGSNEYAKGINELSNSSSELVNGSSEINKAMQQVNQSMKNAPDAPDASDLKQLPQGIRALADGLDETKKGMDTLRSNYKTANESLRNAINEIPNADISEEQIKELLASDADKKVVNQLVESYKAAKKVKGTYNEAKKAFDGVTGTLDDVAGSLDKMAKEARTTADQIEKGLKNMDGLDDLQELQSGLSKMANEYQSFHNGLVKYTDGVDELATNYKKINNGINELANGTGELEKGSSDLKKGTNELENETSDLPGDMQSEIDKMLEEYDGSDFEPTSFVSNDNKHIDVVQFALQTKPIEVDDEKDDKKKKDDKKAEKKGAMTRFKELFK